MKHDRQDTFSRSLASSRVIMSTPVPNVANATNAKDGKDVAIAPPALTLQLNPMQERVKEECEKITKCYCTRHTLCGWCQTTGKALLGTEATPIGGQLCLDWIPHATECPTLYCDVTGAKWWTDCGWFPGLVLLLWVTTMIWRCRLARNFEQHEGGLPDRDDGVLEEDVVNELLRPKRTFEAFRMGLDCPAEDRLITHASVPYQQNTLSLREEAPTSLWNYAFSWTGFHHHFWETLAIAVRWRVALGATLKASFLLMFVSSMYIFFIRNAARFLDKNLYYNWATGTAQMGAVVSSLSTAVSILLSFYALNRISWYWDVMMEGFKIQGRAHDLAMLAGTKKRETEEDWRAVYTFYRHMTLVFFYAYQPFQPKLREVKAEHLVEAGLLTKEESELVQKCHRLPMTVVESWLSHWVETHLRDEARQQAYQALREYRGATASISDWLDQRAPVSFESLLYVVVHMLCFVMPFGPSHIDFKDRESVMRSSHVAPVLGVSMLSAFYMALLHMLRHLQAPFDDGASPHDALNPLQLMISTERKMRDYLSADMPAAMKAWEKKS